MERRLCDGLGGTLAQTVLLQIAVKIIEVLRADVAQLHVADGHIGALHHALIKIYSLSFNPLLLLQIQHIGRILAEGLAVVCLVAQFDVPLKVSGHALERFCNLLLALAGGWCPGLGVLDFFAALGIPGGYGDAIGIAIFTGPFFNARHHVPSLFQVHPLQFL